MRGTSSRRGRRSGDSAGAARWRSEESESVEAGAGAGVIDDEGFFIKLFGRANREACEVGAGADDDAEAALLLFIAAGASAAATAAVFIPGGGAVPEVFFISLALTSEAATAASSLSASVHARFIVRKF